MGALYDLFRIFKVAVLGGRQSEGRKKETPASGKRRAGTEKGDGREACAKKRGRAVKTLRQRGGKGAEPEKRSGIKKQAAKKRGKRLPAGAAGVPLAFSDRSSLFSHRCGGHGDLLLCFSSGKGPSQRDLQPCRRICALLFHRGKLVYALAERIVNAVRLALRFAFPYGTAALPCDRERAWGAVYRFAPADPAKAGDRSFRKGGKSVSGKRRTVLRRGYGGEPGRILQKNRRHRRVLDGADAPSRRQPCIVRCA